MRTSTPGSGRPTEPIRSAWKRVDRDDRRGLGETVPLEDRHAGGVEEPRDVGLSGAPPETEAAEPAADAGREASRTPGVGDADSVRASPRRDRAAVEPKIGPGSAGAAGPFEHAHRPAPPALTVSSIFSWIFSYSLGTAVSTVGLRSTMIRRHRVDTRAVVDQGARVHHHVVARHPLEDVRQRKEREAFVVGVHAEGLDRAHGVRGEVAVGEHDALGVAGGARGVDDRGQVVGPRPQRVIPPRGPAHGLLPAEMHQLADGDDIRRIQVVVEPDDVAEARQVGADLADLLELPGVRHAEDRDPRVAQQELDLPGGKRRVDRHVDAPRREGRKVGVRPLRPVLRQDAHPVAGLQVELEQPETRRPDAIGHLAAADVGPHATAARAQQDRAIAEPLHGAEEQLVEGRGCAHGVTGRRERGSAGPSPARCRRPAGRPTPAPRRCPERCSLRAGCSVTAGEGEPGGRGHDARGQLAVGELDGAIRRDRRTPGR